MTLARATLARHHFAQSKAPAMNVSDARLPIVFLDIDDVLCVNDPYTGSDALEVVCGRHAQPQAVLQALFAAQPKLALERIHAAMHGSLHYVISSGWRQVFTREQIEQVFRGAGMGFVADNLHAQWRTPCPPPELERIDEIDAWLQAHHRGEPFVILDDAYSGPSLGVCSDPTHRFATRVVLCTLRVGLTAEHVPLIVDALSHPCAR
jgi:HAD domain in Swiss Army Knife RNA repair proteins